LHGVSLLGDKTSRADFPTAIRKKLKVSGVGCQVSGGAGETLNTITYILRLQLLGASTLQKMILVVNATSEKAAYQNCKLNALEVSDSLT
jgi:hypothetical protein